MSDTGYDDRVVDDKANKRFVLDPDRGAVLQYRLNGNRFVLVHTEVPESLRGQGIGGRLVSAALERAKSEDLTVVPLCPYVRNWLDTHPDEAAKVRVDWGT